MKKKGKLFLNIATIALCLCAIAVGVYSAKTASLNVGGTVGFVAHNCEVEVVGKITGATNTSGSDTAGTYYITKTQASAPKTESETINVGGSSGTSSAYFGNLHFTHNADANANDIVMEFTITNKSAFDIKASIKTNDDTTVTGLILKDDVSATITNNDAEISANDSATITLTISVAESADEDLADAVTGGISFNFEKYVSIMEYSEDIGWHINMGKVTSALATATGVAENTPIAWVPVLEVASDGSLTAFNGTLQSNKPQTGHTYYFISYNILPVMYGNTKADGMSYSFYQDYRAAYYYNGTTMVKYANIDAEEGNQDISPEDYSVSNMRSYLKGNTAYYYYFPYSSTTMQQLTNFLSLYSITNDPIYTRKISTRTLSNLYNSNSVPTVTTPYASSATTEDKLWLLSNLEYNVIYSNTATQSQMISTPLGGITASRWTLRYEQTGSRSRNISADLYISPEGIMPEVGAQSFVYEPGTPEIPVVQSDGSLGVGAEGQTAVYETNGVRPAFKIVL